MVMRLLVATDGSPSGEAAMRFARTLSRERGSSVELLSVLSPVRDGGFAAIGSPSPGFPSWDTLRADQTRRMIASQAALIGSEAADWPITIELGSPGPTIARIAKERGSALIVLGLRPHGRLERLVHAETALDVLHSAGVPLVAVPNGVSKLPRRVLVAVDFNETSLDVAHSLVPFLGSTATLHLAHASRQLDSTDQPTIPEWQRTYLYGAISRLEEIAGKIWMETGLPSETHVPLGEPVAALLTLAQQLEVDMIACGSRGYGGLRRAMAGSVSSALLRRVGCPLFVTPCHPERSRRGTREDASAPGESSTMTIPIP